MMTFVPAGGTLPAIRIFDFVECRAHGALPAGRLLLVYMGLRLLCDLIHFIYSAFLRDIVADSRLGPKLPQAEDRLLTEVFNFYFITH